MDSIAVAPVAHQHSSELPECAPFHSNAPQVGTPNHRGLFDNRVVSQNVSNHPSKKDGRLSGLTDRERVLIWRTGAGSVAGAYGLGKAIENWPAISSGVGSGIQSVCEAAKTVGKWAIGDGAKCVSSFISTVLSPISAHPFIATTCVAIGIGMYAIRQYLSRGSITARPIRVDVSQFAQEPNLRFLEKLIQSNKIHRETSRLQNSGSMPGDIQASSDSESDDAPLEPSLQVRTQTIHATSQSTPKANKSVGSSVVPEKSAPLAHDIGKVGSKIKGVAKKTIAKTKTLARNLHMVNVAGKNGLGRASGMGKKPVPSTGRDGETGAIKGNN